MNGVSAEQLSPAYGRMVLFCGQAGFTVEDVLTFSWFLGELQPLWRDLLKDLASEELAGEMDLDVDDAALTSMLEEFRYERDLLTVEETERWLEARDLAENDLSDYLIRRYWREHPPGPVTTEDSNYQESSPELRELLRIDLFFSGKFERLIRTVSWRLAASSDEGKTASEPEILNQERARFLERTCLDEASLPEALNQLNRTAKWLEECLQTEVAYRRACEALLTKEARGRTLAVMRLPLTRLKLEIMNLRSRDAAQEAVLCLKENRLSAEELSEECGATWEKRELFLGDFEPTVQQEFLSAATGEVLAPKPCEDGFMVIRIDSKTDPDLADDKIRSRIDRHLLRAHFSELSSRHIRLVLGESQGR